MEIFILLPAFLWVLQFGLCHCKYKIVRVIPLLPVIALFIWIEKNRNPGPSCGMGAAAEGLAIGLCLAGIAMGWITYGLKVMDNK